MYIHTVYYPLYRIKDLKRGLPTNRKRVSCGPRQHILDLKQLYRWRNIGKTG